MVVFSRGVFILVIVFFPAGWSASSVSLNQSLTRRRKNEIELILQCQKVTVSFDGFKAVQGMSLDLPKKSCVS